MTSGPACLTPFLPFQQLLMFSNALGTELPTQTIPSPGRINPFPWSSGTIPRDLCPVCQGVDTHTQICLQQNQKFLWEFSSAFLPCLKKINSSLQLTANLLQETISDQKIDLFCKQSLNEKFWKWLSSRKHIEPSLFQPKSCFLWEENMTERRIFSCLGTK